MSDSRHFDNADTGPRGEYHGVQPADRTDLIEIAEQSDASMVESAVQAALAGVNLGEAQAGTALVVMTCLDALDEILSCLNNTSEEIHLNLRRAERLVALGKMVACQSKNNQLTNKHNRERLVSIPLTERVNLIAEQMEPLSRPALRDAPVQQTSSLCTPSPKEIGFDISENDKIPKPQLTAQFIRTIIRQRQQRARYIEPDLFADPAWDILLDLLAAHFENTKVSVTSLCIASGVASTTALRWIGQMIEVGLLERTDDVSDRRRAYVTLTDKALDSMVRYFSNVCETSTLNL